MGHCCKDQVLVYHIGDTLSWTGKFHGVGYNVSDSDNVTFTCEFLVRRPSDGKVVSRVNAHVTPDSNGRNIVYFTASSKDLTPGVLFIKVFVDVTGDEYRQYVESQIGIIVE